MGFGMHGKPPKRQASETVADYMETLTNWYVGRTSPQYRKARGQYFTPQRTGEFMVRQFDDVERMKDIRVLDPGAGLGVFEVCFCEYIKSLNEEVRVSFDLYENDRNLVNLLRLTMEECKRRVSDTGSEVSYRIMNEDFILSNSLMDDDPVEDSGDIHGDYDFAICNPPYYKIRKHSPEACKMKGIVEGQPNIYPLFMALSALSLKIGGQIVTLTPRSYCSGLYFRRFRKWFLGVVKPQKLHIFESRRAVFKRFDVLQENVVLTAARTSEAPNSVLISVSDGVPRGPTIQPRKTAYDKVVIKRGCDILMRIPSSELDELIAIHVDGYVNSSETIGLKVSTGPVVPFRAKESLSEDPSCCCNHTPLLWMHNIIEGKIEWPIARKGKPIIVKNSDESSRILIPNKNYVLIKRFSTKEGKRRIEAGIYFRKQFDGDSIGVENHVNYVGKEKGELTEDEAHGVLALLSSRLYNRYFQMTNGNTQVNAREISSMPFPSLKALRQIGVSVRFLEFGDWERRERIILEELGVDRRIENGLIGTH